MKKKVLHKIFACVLSGFAVIVSMVGKIFLRIRILLIDLLYQLIQLLFGGSLGSGKQNYFMDAAWNNVKILFKEIGNLIHQVFTGH